MNMVDTPVRVSPDIGKGDAEYSVSDAVKPELSQREIMRARLREKESRLTALIRNTSIDGGGGGYASKMASVQSSLQQVEAEKTELEKELDRLKNATGDDDFLKEKMAGIQEGFHKQVKKIQSLEEEVVHKNNEIEGLREELVDKLRRIIELEFDLETHDVHYTEYAAQQFKLGEDALAEIKSKESKMQQYENGSVASNGGSGKAQKSVSPRRAQELIFKLLSDLDSLEARYKEEKLESTSKIEEIQLENEELRTKFHILEQRLDEQGKQGKESSLDSIDMHNVFVLRKRCETLEAKRTIYRKEMERLHEEIKVLRKEASRDGKHAETEIERLTLENQAMKSRMETLEKDRADTDDPAFNEYAAIEARIQEYFEEIQQLEAAAEIKDRQISTLKKELKGLRAKEIAAGAIEKKPYSDFDSKLLRSVSAKHSKSLDDDRSGITEDTDASLVSDLQNQLREAQQALVKKDQELVIERAKAASTAAGLLARITELSANQPKVDSKKKKKSGKHVPLRFYL